MIIKKITWEDILPIWKNELWPSSVRTSPIEPTSAMCLYNTLNNDKDDIPAQYDLENMNFTPTFWGCFIDNTLIGVNSGHMCIGREYRSRGLWVDPKYRGMAIGTKLLLKTISQGYHEGAILCWSYPRFESWMTYKNAGFYRQNYNFQFEWEESETGKNVKCIISLDADSVRESKYNSIM